MKTDTGKLLKLLFAVGIVSCATVSAQEPTFMEAATHPGRGQFYSRLIFSASEQKESSELFDRRRAVAKLAYGIRSDLALLLDGEFESLDRGGDSERGLSLASVRAKFRVAKLDLGPLNTWRTSIQGGVAVPGGNKAVAPDHTLPVLGAVSTAILGRHGLNAQLEWRGYRDEPDTYRGNLSHLFRISPARYAADTRGAWYTMIESLNSFSDNGDTRYDAAAGLLYEARRWAAEASLRTTLGGDWKYETEHEIAFGLRYLF